MDAVPGRITWEEFVTWFFRKGTERQQLHDCQMYKQGVTRLYESKIPVAHKNGREHEGCRVHPDEAQMKANEYLLTCKMTEHRVRHMLPITLFEGKLNLLLVVFENNVANFYDMS